jgi:uncharacterized protein YigA (DUF484 family)
MNPITPITEDDIANYLATRRISFERHADLLAAVQLTSPHGNRAVSLQERQAEMLREKIKVLEHRLMDMMRHGNENMLIADKLQRWARHLFLVARPAPAADAGQRDRRRSSACRRRRIKVWDVAERYADEPFAQGASDDAKSLGLVADAAVLRRQFGFEAVHWLDDPGVAAVACADAAARRRHPPGPGLWHAGAGLARPQRYQRHGHRFSGAHRPSWPARRCRAGCAHE